jgi:hypothetical protein
MVEKILEIEEGSWDDFDGFRIKTNKQLIELSISSGQCCCETYGYFMTNDKTSDFIGAKILDIQIVDESLNQQKMDDIIKIYEGGTMFVNIITNKGVLQFTAYNEHNGYYGHQAKVQSTQLNYGTTL